MANSTTPLEKMEEILPIERLIDIAIAYFIGHICQQEVCEFESFIEIKQPVCLYVGLSIVTIYAIYLFLATSDGILFSISSPDIAFNH